MDLLKAKISVLAVATALPTVFGGILWLTAIDSKASAAKEEIKAMKQMLIETHDSVLRLEEDFKSLRK